MNLDDVKLRLTHLRSLTAGWLDGDGENIDVMAVDFAQEILEQLLNFDTRSFGIFPRPDGSIQVEWNFLDAFVECAFFRTHTQICATSYSAVIESTLTYDNDDKQQILDDLVKIIASFK